MTVLVSDTSVLIDLTRGSYLESIFSLPYQFAVPDVLYRQEIAGEWGDYSIPSRSWSTTLPTGFLLSKQSIVQECTAIGYTAKGDEDLQSVQGTVHLECVGIPPYPGCFYPRVAGLMTGTP